MIFHALPDVRSPVALLQTGSTLRLGFVEDPTKELELLYDAKEFSEAVMGQIYTDFPSKSILSLRTS
jgi:hypothetical protein